MTFSNISGGRFDRVLPDPTVPTDTGTQNGTGLATARWAVPAETTRSRDDFEAVAIDPIVVDPPIASRATNIASFHHIDLPIFPTSLAAMSLLFTAAVGVDGVSIGRRCLDGQLRRRRCHDLLDNRF